MRKVIKNNLIKHFDIDIDNIPFNAKYINIEGFIEIYGFRIDLEGFTMQTTDRVLHFDEYTRMCNFISDVKQQLDK